MDEKTVAKARRRNYVLDLLRVIAAYLMVANHWIWNYFFPGEIANGYWGAYFWNQNHSTGEDWDWFKGTYTMGFFIFVSGYFLMDYFKRQQRRGIVKSEKSFFGHTWKYTAKTYVSLGPLMLFGACWGLILNSVKSGASFMDVINSFAWNIWQFLGISGFGMHQTGGSAYVGPLDGATWYIAAFIVFCCVFYAILVKSETIAVFVLCPFMFASSNVWLNEWLTADGAQTMFGITTILPQDIVRLWGPLSWGIWGWYIADCLKRANLTKRQENTLGVILLVALAYALITSWTGYLGGMLNQDLVWMIIALIVIVHRDPVTQKIDDILHRFPLSKYFAEFSAGLFVVHLPIIVNFAWDFVDAFGSAVAPWFCFLMVTVGALIYMVVSAVVLKPVFGKLGKIMKIREPVVVDEEALPAPASGK